MGEQDVTEVAPDVFWVRTPLVNWYLLRDGHDLTLVDAGYPGDAGAVEASIGLLGRSPGDVLAVLVTHAHADHTGAASWLHRAHAVPTWCSAAEVAHARRERLEQVGPVQVLARAWRPGVLPWAVRAVRRGGLADASVPAAVAFPTGSGALDLPGSPTPVPTPGHTGGHTAFLLPGAGAVLTGDALVTGHPTSRRAGPQLLPGMFHHDRARAVTALRALADTGADLLLPGHGAPWRGPVAAAVERAGNGP